MTERAGSRRAQLCALACYISAGHAHPQTAFYARTAATPDPAAPIAAPSFSRVIGSPDFSPGPGPQSCALRQSAYNAEPAGHQNQDHYKRVVLLFLWVLLARNDPIPDRVASARSDSGMRTGMTLLCFFVFRSGHRFTIDEMAAVIVTLREILFLHFTILSRFTAFCKWAAAGVVSEKCADGSDILFLACWWYTLAHLLFV